MIRSDEVTIPLPSALKEHRDRRESHHATNMSVPDAQVRLATITQEVQFQLYTERRSVRSTAQMQAIMTSLLSELDECTIGAMQQHEKELQPTPKHDSQQLMLNMQYCRVKILITRPALRCIERCTEAGNEDFTPFDQDVADACIKTAQDVASLLPKEVDLKYIYETGPWWTLVHNSKHTIVETN
jgi:hypothetical protein